MANVLLETVSKEFPDGTIAVDGVSLEIKDREFLVLVGPSGCGKSTTLRLIAGLETSTSGDIQIGDRVVTHVAPKDRDIAMVFQNYALYPHMSVYKNLSFGLTLRSIGQKSLMGVLSGGIFGDGVIARGLRKVFQPRRAAEFAQQREEIDNTVRQTAARLSIEHLLDRKPHQLSGGERQRVALGRAIVRNPAAFLFDEPLSNLDAKLRQQMRVELKRLHRDLNATMIYVTHDQVEAMTLGDRVAVMNDGKILQVGQPLEIYQQPANLFVAKFIGSVPINLCSGAVRQTEKRIRFESANSGNQIEWVPGTSVFQGFKRLLGETGGQLNVVMGFRSEDVRLFDGNETESLDDASSMTIEVEVTEIDRLGESTMIHSAVCVGNEKVEENECSILARLEPGTNVQAGDRVKLKIDPNRILWFDPDTGENLLKEKT
ncbi:MAG: ABC transporter ATP-binding protein [Mariniblastus sp.]